MRLLLRSVLLWMLALALPLQGTAAAANMGCAGEYHAAAAGTMPAHGTVAEHEAYPQHHPHDAGSTTSAETSAASRATAVPGAGAETPQHSAAHSCSACASCCAGFALLTAPLEVTAPEQGGDADTRARATAASVGEDAPERPPRALHA